MAWIGLQDMEIEKVPIGYYDEEKLIGNDFRVSVMANLSMPEPDSDELANTLNYETVFTVVQSIMKEEMDLIETAAYRIYEGLKAKDANFHELEVSIRKYKPLQVKSGGDSVITMRFTS